MEGMDSRCRDGRYCTRRVRAAVLREAQDVGKRLSLSLSLPPRRSLQFSPASRAHRKARGRARAVDAAGVVESRHAHADAIDRVRLPTTPWKTQEAFSTSAHSPYYALLTLGSDLAVAALAAGIRRIGVAIYRRC